MRRLYAVPIVAFSLCAIFASPIIARPSSSGFTSTVVLLSVLVVHVRGHMYLQMPMPMYAKQDKQTPEAKMDYTYTAPLDKTGANYPCKGYITSDSVSAYNPVTTLKSGEDFTWSLLGTATHNGGSCQVAISYDMLKTQVVMASWAGACPLAKSYKFKIPELPAAKKALFIWSWMNKTGNREMYQNCAVVTVEGTAKSFTGPSMFRANTFSDGTCIVPEGTDFVFPRPGSQVFYGGDSTASSKVALPAGCDSWNKDSDVTTTAEGGTAGPAGPAQSPTNSDQKQTGATSGAAGNGTAAATNSGGSDSTTTAAGGANSTNVPTGAAGNGTAGGGGATVISSASTVSPAGGNTAAETGSDQLTAIGGATATNSISAGTNLPAGSTSPSSSIIPGISNFALAITIVIVVLILIGCGIVCMRRGGKHHLVAIADDSDEDEKPRHHSSHSRRRSHHPNKKSHRKNRRDETSSSSSNSSQTSTSDSER